MRRKSLPIRTLKGEISIPSEGEIRSWYSLDTNYSSVLDRRPCLEPPELSLVELLTMKISFQSPWVCSCELAAGARGGGDGGITTR